MQATIGKTQPDSIFGSPISSNKKLETSIENLDPLKQESNLMQDDLRTPRAAPTKHKLSSITDKSKAIMKR
eukprot:CAMPEP_0202962562 /NCGR_PEP_ID=MMETSP1396-20130829/6676_1 /ASSEMBLY_ACC=CAM_ASM_000872 /TAXON_ID= /ORGANISM="Pseudokeronopsis sp., Strain Brazil" /LENGTH=70 /DNA_ID=CAMNT_0049683251 /DNA_START=680 /DNA_END=892 /DNA_ORIENTATION=+